MKDNKEVISEFNEYVNMTASELDKWLESDDSTSAGWTKDGGEGESVGHDSGRKIVEILKSNPDKAPDKYTDDQLEHMRKVASYCKRHLAQEASSNSDKDPEEVKKTKSYISLKNWGHDFLKAQGKESGSAKGGSKSGSKKKEDKKEENKKDADEDEAKEEENGHKNGDDKEGDDEEENEEEGEEGEEEEEEEEEGNKDKKAGDKRKKSGQQNGSNKKQETRKTRSSDKKDSKGEEAEDDQDGGEDGEDDEKDGEDDEKDDEDDAKNGDSGGKSSKKGPKKGDTVSWNWGSGNPQGKVLDVKEDKYVSTANMLRETWQPWED